VTRDFARRSPYLVLPAVGIVAPCWQSPSTKRPQSHRRGPLLRGRTRYPGSPPAPRAWSISALLLLLLFKGLAWGISLGSFRGGPTFPALFIAPPPACSPRTCRGFEPDRRASRGDGRRCRLGPATALSAWCSPRCWSAKAGVGASPLIIVGVVVAYLVTIRPRPEVRRHRDRIAGGALTALSGQ